MSRKYYFHLEGDHIVTVPNKRLISVVYQTVTVEDSSRSAVEMLYDFVCFGMHIGIRRGRRCVSETHESGVYHNHTANEWNPTERDECHMLRGWSETFFFKI